MIFGKEVSVDWSFAREGREGLRDILPFTFTLIQNSFTWSNPDT